MCAISTALTWSSSKPFRIFTVTGFWIAPATFSIIFPARSGFFIRAEPSPLFTTFGTGQPMLISKISNGRSSICFAISPIISGSDPKSCKETGVSRGSIVKSSCVFLFLYKIALALTISIQRSPAPCSLHSKRNGRSVTPAIGAKIRLFSNVTFPICSFRIAFIVFPYLEIICFIFPDLRFCFL